ncbi:MAG: hypothetical protein ACO1Q7_17445 [Gemmatimonas sp.]
MQPEQCVGPSDSIPRDLAENLLFLFERSNPRIVVGEIAPNFPSEVDTSGWRVLGHVQQPQSGTVTVFGTDRSDTEFVREVRTRFDNAGFRRPDQSVGGYSPNAYALTQGFERDGTTAYYEIRDGGSGFLLVTLIQTLDVAVRVSEPDAHRGNQLPPLMPSLTNPVGTQITDASAGSSGLVHHTAITITPRMDLIAALEHCASELREQGWREVGRDIDESAAAVYFRHWTPDCGPRTGTLSVFDDRDRDALQLTFSKCDMRGNPYKRRMYGDSIEPGP